MKNFQKGEGEPELAVIYCTHGNEVEGKKAVENLIKSKTEFKKPVKFVMANEKAYESGERFIDSDLNRSFPGSKDSELYEERIAAEIIEELEDLKVLDIHSTESRPTPFSLFTSKDEKVLEAIKELNVSKAVEISFTPGCGINLYGGVEVEVGPRGTDEAVKQAEKVLRQFLVNNGVIEGEKNRNVPEVFEVTGEVGRPEGDWEFLGENFVEIKKKETFAQSDKGALEASESFYPVLMSESYDDILGFKSVKNEKLTELIQYYEC
jgi:predicted deacylase